MSGWLSSIFKRKNPNMLDIGRVVDDTNEEEQLTVRAERANSFMEVVVITDYGYKRKGVAIDVSETGARIRFHTTESMPARVRLKIPQMKLDKTVDIVWHNGVDVGVRFA